VRGSFSKAKCTKCGEYVFERYVRTVDGQPHCIPCAGHGS
jgi:formylmethanofuran dehydrogenase subunit E